MFSTTCTSLPRDDGRPAHSIRTLVIEQEQRRQLLKIRQQLADLESGGPVIEV